MGEEGRKSASALKAGLTMQGADVAQIGDGVTSLCEAGSSGSELEKFAALLRSSQDPVTIILFAHSSEGKHLIHLGPGFDIATKDFFDLINGALNGRKCDIFMMTCYGGSPVLKGQSMLLESSTCISLGGSAQLVSLETVDRLIKRLCSREYAPEFVFSAEKLMMIYLTQVTRVSSLGASFICGENIPEFNSGYSPVDLQKKLSLRTGIGFSDNEKEKVVMLLSSFHEREYEVRYIMSRILNAETIKTAYYNLALAICHAASGSCTLKRTATSPLSTVTNTQKFIPSKL